MPLVTQVTFVRRGRLTVTMKGHEDATPYSLRLAPDEAVLTEPGVFLQLVNDESEPCDVLYVVSPAYVFEIGSDGVVAYDDSVVLDEDWNALAAAEWQLPRGAPTSTQRDASMRRLSSRSAASA